MLLNPSSSHSLKCAVWDVSFSHTCTVRAPSGSISLALKVTLAILLWDRKKRLKQMGNLKPSPNHHHLQRIFFWGGKGEENKGEQDTHRGSLHVFGWILQHKLSLYFHSWFVWTRRVLTPTWFLFLSAERKRKQFWYHSSWIWKKKKWKRLVLLKFNEVPISKSFKLCPNEYMLQSYPKSRWVNCGVQNSAYHYMCFFMITINLPNDTASFLS